MPRTTLTPRLLTTEPRPRFEELGPQDTPDAFEPRLPLLSTSAGPTSTPNHSGRVVHTRGLPVHRIGRGPRRRNS